MSNSTNMNYVGGKYPEHLLDILGFERCDDWSTRDSETLTAKDSILKCCISVPQLSLRYESMPIIGKPGFATNYDGIISTKSVSWMAQHDCEDARSAKTERAEEDSVADVATQILRFDLNNKIHMSDDQQQQASFVTKLIGVTMVTTMAANRDA
ncbi:hypothetical protein DDE83_005352 [Stemphylium lycopersici]|uniref:Uncharacterized protein n=1 Tax=Stemphylium lycopersici TaxID=183478 RepID=A0A364N217_STELY|nr:hypothetical protein DDE83_005352 [Stemphylium lycopersici]